jgi:cell wall-associated NlpC family hydrolase
MTTTMSGSTTETWRLGIPDETWAFEAPRPGVRDLAEHELWERSEVRSRLRRESAAARKVGVRRGARSRLAMALVGVTLAVPATEAVTAGSAQAAPLSTGVLRRGDTGAKVEALQRALGVTADGSFGNATHRAVRAYQRAHGLEVDGVVGPRTAAALGLSISGSTTRSASTTTSSGSSSGSSSSASPSSAVAAVRSKIGASYAYGGTGPSSFDCSGLTQWAFKRAGVSLPRTSFAQYGVGSAVSKANVQAGDLVFFSTAGAGASHVGIAVSSSSAVSATSHGVMEHSFTSGYWSQNWVGARRV